MNCYDAEEDLKQHFYEYEECYKDNIKYIDENNGENLDLDEKNILIAGFLMNMHDTLSEVSSNLCELSKSVYEPNVYIDEISEYQKKLNESFIKEDLEYILNEDLTDKEKIEEIKKYTDRLG